MIYCLGSFDGFHKGHQELLKVARKIAKYAHTDWGIITFTRNPIVTLLYNDFKQLFFREERNAIAITFGCKCINEIDFTPGVALMSPKEFFDYIVDKFNVTGLVVGEDFHFGCNKSGDTDLLTYYSNKKGIICNVVPTVTQNAQKISTSIIRDLVSQGAINMANRLLGYSFFITGYSIHGDNRGSMLGYPTANLPIEGGKIYPPDGVYAAATVIHGKTYAVALNVGSNPTFNGFRPPRMEAHILGNFGNLYGRKFAFFIFKKVRPEVKFENKEMLLKRIKIDVEETKRHFESLSQVQEEKINKISSYLVG